MRGYIFTPHEIRMIERFRRDGVKFQAVRLLKHRCEENRAKLEKDLQTLDTFLEDYGYSFNKPECYGSDKIREVYLDCLNCPFHSRCVTEYVVENPSALLKGLRSAQKVTQDE